jgi:CheY-like chemotaxis protein/anti-sigma regulatory factor (Ser/Thr protein kinase)
MLSIKIYEKDLELICRIAPAIPEHVIGDPTRFRQILLNLLSNAYKFTEEGEICIEVSAESKPGNLVIMKLVVSDTGIGIPANKLSRIFQSFTQAEASISRKYGGTGLGLSIARKLLDLMKGDILVESEPGKGSRFTVTIPFQTAAPSDHHDRGLEELVARYSPVLIIEKNGRGAKAAQAAFETLPFQYHIVSEQVADIPSILKMTDGYKLVIIDSGVETTNGESVSRQLPGLILGRSGIPVIIMAPSTINLNRDDLQDKGLTGILRKPLFARTISELLAGNMLAAPVPESAPGQEVPEEQKGRHLRILLAEDNPINTRIAVGLLKLKKWEVECAVNGIEAVSKFSASVFDLVLMDIQMPEMDGLEATVRIREIEASGRLTPTPVIGLSAYAMKEDIERAIDCGVDDYLTKPFKPNELYALIENLTRGQSGTKTQPTRNEHEKLVD